MKLQLITLTSMVLLTILNTAHAKPAEEPAEKESLIAFQFAVYLLPDCGKAPSATATKLAKKELPSFTLIDTLQSERSQPTLNIQFLDNVKETYSPPDSESLAYFGYGINSKQGKQLQTTDRAILLNYTYPLKYAFKGMKQAIVYTEKLARACNGLIWDEATREVYSPEYWHKQRIQTWQENNINIKDHIVIHAYQNGEYVRAVTLGMEKFNLPDIAVNDFLWSSQHNIGHLMNAISQSFIEGNAFDNNWMLTIDVNAFTNEVIRKSLTLAFDEKIASTIKIPLKVAAREEGDANNDLLEINFEPMEGKTLQEKQEKMLSTLFGSKDNIVYIKHNEEIKQASQRAKEKIPQLKKEFNQGLKPGEFIYLKAPFAVDEDNNEWMWVEVITWKDKRVKGILQNDAYNIPDLHAGTEVTIDEGDIFDYIRNFPDGSSEGNETGDLILKYQER